MLSRYLSAYGMTFFRIFCKECGFWCGVYRMMVYLYSSYFVVINIIKNINKGYK